MCGWNLEVEFDGTEPGPSRSIKLGRSHQSAGRRLIAALRARFDLVMGLLERCDRKV